MIYGLCLSVSSALIISRIAVGVGARRCLCPERVYRSVYLNWKWRNFLISFVHAVITGVGSLVCVCINPKLLADVIDTYMEFAYLLTCFSHGYFIYDLIEMIKNIQYKGSKELVLHHIMILMCFSITVIERKYVGYCCTALLIELSNIFLHFRQLLIIASIEKSSLIYRINSFINLVIFVIIRGLCMFWLWHTLYLSFDIVPIIVKSIAFVSLIGITIITMVLLHRLITVDLIRFKYSEKKYRDSLDCKTKVSENGAKQINDRNDLQHNGSSTSYEQK